MAIAKPYEPESPLYLPYPKWVLSQSQGLERSDFKSMSIAAGIPYQNLINLYLDCTKTGRKLSLAWKK